MLIGFHALSDCVVNNILPSKTTYSKLTFNGEATYDGIHVKSVEDSNEDLLDIDLNHIAVTKNDTATTTEDSYLMIVDRFVYIINDSPYYDLYVSFDETFDTATNYLVIKPLQALSSLPYHCYRMYVKSSSGNIPYRIMAVRTEESFGVDTILLGNFEMTLEAGSVITTLDLPLNEIVIRRQEEGSSLNPIIAELTYDPSVVTYTDYTPKNRVNYTYSVSPSLESGGEKIVGQGIEGSGSVSFFGWILTNTDGSTQFLFDLMNNTNNIETVTDLKIYENYTQFPAFRFGNMKYKKSSLTTIPYNYNDVTGEHEIDLDVLNSVETFINNGEEKILRNTIGEAYKVITNNFSYKFKDETSEQIYEISFEFIQSGEVT